MAIPAELYADWWWKKNIVENYRAHTRETEEREFGMMSRFQSFFPSEKKGKKIDANLLRVDFFGPRYFSSS